VLQTTFNYLLEDEYVNVDMEKKLIRKKIPSTKSNLSKE
jgi:hypothetical protein